MKYTLGFLLLLLASAHLEGQVGPFASPVVTRLSLDEGLPHRSNYSAVYDRDSILWLSTEGGVCRNDRYRVSSFSQFEQSFKGVIRRNEGDLLYACPQDYRDSVEVLDPNALTATGEVLSRGLPGAFAGAVHKDDEPLYFAQGGFVYRYQYGAKPVVEHELSSEVSAEDELISASPSSYVLFRSQDHALEELGPDGKTIRTKLPATASAVTFYAARDGSTWIMTSEGLYQKPLHSGRLQAGPELSTGKPVNLIFEDHHNNLIFANRHPDLLRIQGIVAQIDGVIHPLQWLQDHENRITYISGTDFTKEMNVSSHGGLLRVDFTENHNSPFRRHLYDPNVESGNFGHVMRGFAADDEGNVYTNKDTRQPHWFRVNKGALTLDTLVMRDNHGRVVDNFGCGTNLINYHGDIIGSSCSVGEADTAHVYRYRPADGSWTRWELPEVDERIRWIMPISTSDQLIIATEGRKGKGGSLYYFLPETGIFTPIQPEGPEYYLEGYPKHGIEDTSRNIIWLGTTTGLYCFNPTTKELTRKQLYSGRATEISHVHLRPNGELLLGTFKKGLLRYVPEEERFLRVGGIPSDEDPLTQSSDFLALPSNDIASLAVTEELFLLITTFNGLTLHGHTLHAGSTYTIQDGLPSNEFNTPSLFYNEHDSLWYAGGINGFTFFRIKDLLRPPSHFKPSLLRVRFLDEKAGYEQTTPLTQTSGEPLIIPPSVSYFSLEYILPDYSRGRPLLYQTMLANYDDQWRSLTETPSVRYTKLPPGQYEFRLKAIDGKGRSTSEAEPLIIIVEKPWYKTGIFYGFCLFVSVLTVGSYLLGRERRLKQKFYAKRQVQELELRVLRQQLNPHFISNAMNAIRDFIYLESKEEAAGYLTDFTRLMRLFLEASRNRFTTISDEKDLLERYIRLEQLRYPGKFNYSINIDPDIRKDMDEVPSLLLQPIVENAINHGLSHLEKDGLVTVCIALDPQDEEIINCTITDNGIGRKRAAELNASSNNHVSRATQILTDRQQLLEADGIVRLTIVAKDAWPGKENPGTMVSVRVEPMEEKV